MRLERIVHRRRDRNPRSILRRRRNHRVRRILPKKYLLHPPRIRHKPIHYPLPIRRSDHVSSVQVDLVFVDGFVEFVLDNCKVV